MTPELIAADPGWPHSKAKTAVLAAAAAVIKEDGPRSATLKNIASRAGITEPAIFRHFEGVDGLFAGLFHAVERIFNRIASFYAEGEPGLARFRNVILLTMAVMADARDFAYVVINAEQVFRGYPELRRRLAELKMRDAENAIASVKAAQERREIRQDVAPESIAAAVVGMMHMTLVMWVDGGYAGDLKAEAARRWDDAERLMAVPPPCLD